MGKRSLYIFLMLALMGCAFEGMKGVASNHPVAEGALDQAAAPENKVTAPTPRGSAMPVGTIAAPGGKRPFKTYISILVTFWSITGFWYFYYVIGSLVRRYQGRLQMPTPPDTSPEFSDDDVENVDSIPFLRRDQAEAPEDVPVLSSDQAQAPEDALNIQGLFVRNRREPKVTILRVRPRRPNDPGVSSPSDDDLELQFQAVP